jgi:hypothetical protein
MRRLLGGMFRAVGLALLLGPLGFVGLVVAAVATSGGPPSIPPPVITLSGLALAGALVSLGVARLIAPTRRARPRGRAGSGRGGRGGGTFPSTSSAHRSPSHGHHHSSSSGSCGGSMMSGSSFH